MGGWGRQRLPAPGQGGLGQVDGGGRQLGLQLGSSSELLVHCLLGLVDQRLCRFVGGVGSLLCGGNGLGVFTRTGRGRNAIKHAYGPSVDQVFRGVIRDIESEIGLDLREAILKQTEYEVRKALKLL